ncbi:gaba transporter 1 [Phtheirospermum japonicum]|uniref:Gaba transporter 1 n=1 Tax=Phtheirospermum japonicum TaxID=374723 RepID=A0A830CSN2_9LAMI|nr:gaba transporter 1 [Phtheirospermum japonicum]
MGSVGPSSTEFSGGKDGKSPPPAAAGDKELDAGAQFVLKSRGSWIHSGYHLTTSIVAPPLLSLPFAFASLGWTAGIVSLVIGALVTFYSYNLLSLVLEHYAQLGRRHLRFRDMANDILGPKWGRYYVGPIQFLVCYGAVVGSTLLGGQCMKAIYLLSRPDGNMKLYEFVIIFGGLMLILAQIPSFHSLRHINLVSLLLCLAYSACATAGSIYIVVTATFFSVSISGYWAFGNQADGLILTNFLGDGKTLVPKWFVLMTNAFTILQLSAVAVVYLQPTNEVLERTFADPTSAEFSARNVVPRVIARSLSVVIATTIAAMLPFFGDINVVIGAFGFMPLDFVLPVVFFNVTFKPSKRGLVFWLNSSIAVVFSVLGVIAAVAAVRQISLDAKTYKLFANI